MVVLQASNIDIILVNTSFCKPQITLFIWLYDIGSTEDVVSRSVVKVGKF